MPDSFHSFILPAPRDRIPGWQFQLAPEQWAGFGDIAFRVTVRGKQAQIIDGPTYRPIWNGKELAVRDCNGRVLCFGQAMG